MRKIACLILITLPSIALPDVKYVVIGLDETLTENVLSHVDMVQFGPRARCPSRMPVQLSGPSATTRR
jgi:hypothetical protein